MAVGSADEDRKSDLERTISLSGAITIGTGTMVGAGIFVFPGIAVEAAGPAAMFSFAIGAVVAACIALPTAELATAMPESGGGYYFVSRGLGTAAGCIVGVGLTLGLVFAAAFYLVGFGEYAVAVVTELGLHWSVSNPVEGLSVASQIGVGAGAILTALGILGTENVEEHQKTLVGILVAILVVFLLRSGLDVIGVLGRSRVPRELVPYGYGSILTTTALVFTSYLGFAQIATVAGEIVDPERNLPLALLGSVVLVGGLYVGTVFVAASTFRPAVLGEFGETATIEVARVYLGGAGAIVVLVAGFLATMSSANASLLSGSRTLYALSRDSLVPATAGRISQRYGTPHFALSFVGSVAVFLVVLGRIDVLAEVASFLHLVMYGLMCLTQLKLSRTDPEWYDPTFRCPGRSYVPIGGAIASLGLIAFMQPLSQATGAVVAVAGAGWYYFYGRDVQLAGRNDR
jgi:amino acid transporter